MTRRITLKIQGMECPNCAMALEGIEDSLKGILSAEASYRKAQMVVEYNDTQVSEAQIHAAVKRLGYQVVSAHPE
jgi:P-type Cu+ transporter